MCLMPNAYAYFMVTQLQWTLSSLLPMAPGLSQGLLTAPSKCGTQTGPAGSVIYYLCRPEMYANLLK